MLLSQNEEYLLLLFTVEAFAIENGHTAFELCINRVCYFLVAVANNEKLYALSRRVDNVVDKISADEHREIAKHYRFYVMLNNVAKTDDNNVAHQK